MKQVDETLLTAMVDAALGAIEDGDGGAELERLGILYPDLRADLYREVIEQQRFGHLSLVDPWLPTPERNDQVRRAVLGGVARQTTDQRKAQRRAELRRERLVYGALAAGLLAVLWAVLGRAG